jgi:hypothetical protein
MNVKLALPLALATLGLTAGAASAQTLPGGLPPLPGGLPGTIRMPVEEPMPTIKQTNCRVFWVRDEDPPYRLHAETTCFGFQVIQPAPLPPVALTIRP